MRKVNRSSVRYEAVNAMLLNEFLKEHCQVRRSAEATSSTSLSNNKAIAQQQRKSIGGQRPSVKKQAWTQIEKVESGWK